MHVDNKWAKFPLLGAETFIEKQFKLVDCGGKDSLPRLGELGKSWVENECRRKVFGLGMFRVEG
jgi:hypothetical protein